MTAPEAEPARPWARRAIWAGAALAVAAVVYLAAVTSVRFEGEAEVSFAPDAEAATLPSFEGGTHILNYRHHGTVTFSFPLRNVGLLPVTVTDVRLDDGVRSLLLLEDVVIDGRGLPTRVGARTTAVVEVTARYDNCRYYHERELDLLAAATVETRALGVGATRTVDFDHPLVVTSPMIVDCPDRTLVRDDDVRR